MKKKGKMEIDSNVTQILEEAGEGQEIILEIDKSADGDCEDGEIEEIVEIIEEIEEVEEVEETELQNEKVEEVEQVVEHESHEQVYESSNNIQYVQEENDNYNDKVNLKSTNYSIIFF